VTERAKNLAVRLVAQRRELEAAFLEEGAAGGFQHQASRSQLISGILQDEEGISDPISLQLVIASMPAFDPVQPPSKKEVQEFADFLEAQFHLSDKPRE
jgi:hypothetical protein